MKYIKNPFRRSSPVKILRQESKLQQSQSIKCPHCGKSHRAGARFCSRTGKDLPAVPVSSARHSSEKLSVASGASSFRTKSVVIDNVHCPNCGEILSTGRKARFCNHCGFSLESHGSAPRYKMPETINAPSKAGTLPCPYAGCSGSVALGHRYCTSCYKRVRFCDKCNGIVPVPSNLCQNCKNPMGPDPADWLMLNGDPQRTGRTADTIKPDLKLCWTYPDRDKAEGMITSPLIYKGIVFFGSCDRHLHALNQYNGGIVWKRPTNGNILSTPAILNDDIFMASCDGHIYAQKAVSGRSLWIYPKGRELDLGSITAPLLVFEGGLVAVLDNGGIICLDPENGTLRWAAELKISQPDGGPGVSGLTAGAAYRDGRIFIPHRNGKVYCLNASDGGMLWSFPQGEPVESRFVSTPSLAADHCYVPDRSGKFYSLSEATGEDSWHFTVDLDGVVEGSPSIASDKVIIGTGTQHLVALSLHAGGEIWRRKNDKIRLVDAIFSTPAITSNGLVFVGSNSGYIYCRDLESGDEVWKYRLDSPIRSSPAVSDGFLYVAASDGILHAFRAL